MGRSQNHKPLDEQPLLSRPNPLFNRQRTLFSGVVIPAVIWSLSSPAWASISKLAALDLDQIQAAPALVAQADYSILAVGSSGDRVSHLQATLKLLGFYSGNIDGTYSQATQDAVAQFQSAAGITADGIVGPSTWDKLLPAPDAVAAIPDGEVPPAPPANPPASTPESSGPVNSSPENSSPENSSPEPSLNGPPPVLRVEAVGSAVSQLQSELQSLGYYKGEIDGGYGEQTEAAVRQFQSDQQLAVDGVVGPSTWDALSRELAQ